MVVPHRQGDLLDAGDRPRRDRLRRLGGPAFPALSARGRRLWQLRAGGIFDAAAALEPRRPYAVTISAGDEKLYRLRTAPHARHRVAWTFRPTLAPVGGQQVSWWEGNVARRPDGDIYAGNTGGGAYA